MPDRSEQRAVRLVRQLHADGLSLRKIAAELLRRRMSGRRGQPISPKTVRAVILRG